MILDCCVQDEILANARCCNQLVIAVYKVEMHCLGCRQKMHSIIKDFQGVDVVKVDISANKFIVIGKFNKLKLLQKLKSKTKKKVQLFEECHMEDTTISTNNLCGARAEKMVVLQMNLHCEVCIQEITQTLFEIDGVEGVVIDSRNDRVTLRGSIDVVVLQRCLKEKKLKRCVEIVCHEIEYRS